ncbi:MAG: PQQ-dependent sugar dehydrogenase [Caldilineaceae bacterium]|nr:PQQ-dependent sugar dehydrogenase [Caldilineaceae bacterium]
MKRFLLTLFWGVITALLLASCATPPTNLPPLTFEDPNILGIERVDQRSLVTLEDAVACLASRRPVYGVMTENTNVRPQTEVGACRVGRVPQGTVVRFDSLYATGDSTALFDTRGAGEVPAAGVIGYEEDVRPIFQRTCNSCHSAIVQNKSLQVTAYEPLMAGSESGPVVVPGEPDDSLLWAMIESNTMPMIGELSDLDKETVRLWITAGAPERRSPLPARDALWAEIDSDSVDPVNNACAPGAVESPGTFVNAGLILPVSCGAPPAPETLAALTGGFTPTIVGGVPRPQTANAANTEDVDVDAPAAVAAAPVAVYAGGANAAAAGIQAAALNLAPPSDSDGWLTPQGGFCIERRLAKNTRSITAITFAPDGRMFLALDSPPTGEADPLVLYDAHHPSRSVAVYDYEADANFREILMESTRITGLDWYNGALYLSRAGEVGVIPDGGSYQALAGGFAVNSQLFHANNGIVIANGYVYVSAGGVIDGWSDGPIEGMDEVSANNIAGGGNPYAARIVRAPLDALLSQRSINAFSTAALGVRNPYGITVDPSGRIWFTDNGATNVPENMSAGDEVNMLNPSQATGSDATAPYYGFPLALTGNYGSRYVAPVATLINTAAPTGISWAYGTIFFGQYGKDPGLYRLGNVGGQIVAERVMLVWPLLAVATAPDGALWIGTGDGGLYRITPGC